MSGPAPKATIADIHPYVAGKAKAAGFDAPLKLSANENCLGCSPAARAAYLATAEALHVYADPNATALREAIAKKHELDPRRIIFGAGSDELFSMVCQAYLSPGDTMVQPQFAFAAWAIAAKAAGANVRAAPERNYTVNVDAMLEAVDANTRVMFVANPASPTGTRITFTEIERLHAALPEHVLLVLDGAYAEFADGERDYTDGLSLAASAPNVLVTHTFSKIHGLAALRIGWGYSSAAIADTLNRIRLPFNAPTPAQAAALAALEDETFIEASARHARVGREELTRLCRELGLAPLPASANFVTVRVPAGTSLDAAGIERALSERGILVRGLTNYAMPDALRITVPATADSSRLAKELAAILGR